jgi:hypothetical protein
MFLENWCRDAMEKNLTAAATVLIIWSIKLPFPCNSHKGQGRIRGRFGPQNISSYFTDHPIQKNVVILLVTNLSEIIRIRSHFDGEYLQKIIEFSVDPYLCSISPECRIFLQFFKFDLYWSKRAFNSASFHIRTITISLQNDSWEVPFSH